MTTYKADYGILALNGVSFALAQRPVITADGMFYARLKIYMNELVKALGERNIYGELTGTCQPQYFDMQYVYEKDGEFFLATYKKCLLDSIKSTFKVDDVIVAEDLKIFGELVDTQKVERPSEPTDRPNN